MAITNATVVPIIWAANLVRRYERMRVYAARTDRQWQSALNAGGDTVRLNQANLGTVADYPNVGTPITYTAADVTALTDLTMDKTKYFAASIEDIDELESIIRVLDAATEQNALALANQVDADVRTKMVASATDFGATAINMGAAIALKNLPFIKAMRLMDLANMPQEGRWMIVGPYGAEAVRRASFENAQTDTTNPDVSRWQNGQVGRIMGVNVYADSGENSVATNAGANVAETWLMGNDSATAFIDSINTVEPIRLVDRFANAVRGQYKYGAKVVHAGRLWKTAVAMTGVDA